MYTTGEIKSNLTFVTASGANGMHKMKNMRVERGQPAAKFVEIKSLPRDLFIINKATAKWGLLKHLEILYITEFLYMQLQALAKIHLSTDIEQG